MRAIWSGEITFGLVNVPVKLYGATRSHDVSFHQVHDEDQGRIRYERRCDVCGRVIDYDHIEKAYAEGDKTVVLSDEELESLPAEESDEIDVVQFIPGDQVDAILLGTAYVLEPVGRSPKSYVLLRRTLENSDRTAIVTFTLRTKTRLGVLRSRGNLLTLQTMRWPEDIQEVDFPSARKRPKISAKELDMAGALVDQFSGDFEPEKYGDEYQEQLHELLEDKLEQGDAVDTDATFGREHEEKSEKDDEGGKVISLMDALDRSLQKRGGSGGSATSKSSSGSGKTSSAKTSGAKKGSSSSKKTSSSSGAKSSGGSTKKSSKRSKSSKGSITNSTGSKNSKGKSSPKSSSSKKTSASSRSGGSSSKSA
ncbi:Ku protein [Brachybacterium endophyticum]|uniref:Non-homologous end joining protein Ku n=1 Tax=Brachybacterium endophyticum TaxID=2182385 RepID=A0A2U2RNY4_9MICO|nr:Ku protein [Brachybacterium endophyticum]PWH07577.1 Ku protein [Brachybacterium endophyticum]